MKKTKILLMSLVFLVAFLVISSFNQSNTHVTYASTVKINISKKTLYVGDNLKLSLTGASGKVTWKSNNTSIATVSDKGKVVAKKAGKAVISATFNKKTYKSTLTIKNAPAQASSIKLEAENGGDLVTSEATAILSFKLNSKSTDVRAKVINNVGDIVKTFKIDLINANKEKKITWNLKNDKNVDLSAGLYTIQIVAGGITSVSDYFTIYNPGDFASGNGSEQNPYIVTSIKELDNVRYHNNCYFKQKNDLDFAYTSINPLFASDEGARFTGVFDGNGYKISNFLLTSANDKQSLFGSVDTNGVLKNITLDGASVSGNSKIGCLASVNWGTIISCKVINSSVSASGDYAALIVSNNAGKIDSCNSTGVVVGGTYAGGITAYSSGNVLNCSSSADITAKYIKYMAGAYSGGIVAYNDGAIIMCNASGAIYSELSGNAGGIAGFSSNLVKQSTYTGNSVTNKEGHGGDIVGNNEGIIQ